MYKVLIVDDERIVKLAIKAMIKWGDSGFELAGTASNGNSALEMVHKLKPDIIVTDIKMPIMDGVMLIKKLNEIGFDGEILVLSNYNDFDLVKEAMRYGAHDYVLKITVKSEDFSRIFAEMVVKLENKRGISSRSKVQDENYDSIRENLIKQILLSEKEDFSNEAAKLTKIYTLDKNDLLFSFVICGEMKQNDRVTRQLPEVLQSIAEEFLTKSKWYSVIEIDDNTIFIAVLYRKADFNFSSEGLAIRLVELIETYFNIKTGIVYSQPANEYSEFFGYSRKCIRASECLFYTENAGKAIEMGINISEDDIVLGNIYKSISDKIYQDLLKFNDKIVMEYMEYIVNQAYMNNLNPFRLKKFIKRILRDVERKLINNGYCNEELFDEYTKDEDAIYAAKSEKQLINCLKELLETAKDRISASRADYRKEVREAIEYIEEHARGKITLSDIAKHVNLNDSYLCKVFKDDTGKSIVPYVNEVKMKIAYGLLNKGYIMIKEAAAAVGIDDQFYFNRLFKKIYGITPREIKKK